MIADPIQSRFADVSGTRLHYLTAGEGAPVILLHGPSGELLIEQERLVAESVKGVIMPESGHWLMEEAPAQTIQALVEFLGR